jgi:hypothetical protein
VIAETVSWMPSLTGLERREHPADGSEGEENQSSIKLGGSLDQNAGWFCITDDHPQTSKVCYSL